MSTATTVAALLELLRLRLGEIRAIDLEIQKGESCGGAATALEAQRHEKLLQLAVAADSFASLVMAKGEDGSSKQVGGEFHKRHERSTQDVLADSRAAKETALRALGARRQ